MTHISPMDTNSTALCLGCFAAPSAAGTCPACGFDSTAKAAPNALAPGTLLHGQFVLGRVLGKPGGFGVTYLGFDRQLETTVAIKEYLPRDWATRDSDGTTVVPHAADEAEAFQYGIERFLAEARLLARLDHPNIVRVRQFFAANASAYLVMDYYRGLTLAEHLAQQPDGRLPERQALDLMLPVLDGLRAVHAQGVLHRDIKPANIYLAQTEAGGVRPILLDFGAARQAAGERSRSLSVVVSDGYAPFEQYSRKGRQGPWTDVYSAAAVLYRMLTGSVPPPAPDRFEEDELRPASSFGVSQSVSEALSRALAADSAARPQTLTALQRMLSDSGRPTQGSRTRGAADTADQPPAQREHSSRTALPRLHLDPDIPTRTPPTHVAADQGPAPPSVRRASARPMRPLGDKRLHLLLGVATGLAAVTAMLMLFPTSEPDTPAVAATPPAAAARGDEDRAFARAQRAGSIAAYRTYLARCELETCTHAAEAHLRIGRQLADGDGVRKDPVAALLWLERAAEGGSVEAQFRIGVMYADGQGTARNHAQARHWLERAAKSGHINGQARLGLLLEAERNYQAAAAWYAEAAQQGQPEAQYRLARLHRAGRGVPRDDAAAADWHRKAAAQGHAAAQTELGRMYATGQGVARNEARAADWYRKAAEQGHASAQLLLAGCYAAGNGVPRNDREAFRWYRSAALDGEPEAQYRLGVMYNTGSGVAQDLDAARAWLGTAAEGGSAAARAALASLPAAEPPPQTTRAQPPAMPQPVGTAAATTQPERRGDGFGPQNPEDAARLRQQARDYVSERRRLGIMAPEYWPE
jgi:TPR repeat protein